MVETQTNSGSVYFTRCHVTRGHISGGQTSKEQEDEADAFARDILVTQEQYEIFIRANCFSKDCIIAFAHKIGIAPGIVLGRLQKENYVPYNRYNDLKVKYRIAC